MKVATRQWSRLAGALLVLGAPAMAIADSSRDEDHDRNVVRRAFQVTTQARAWPPSTLTDANGDFVVIGDVLRQTAPGVIAPVPGAALVSKHTVPPLNAQGKEDFSNFFGAPHRVIRELDLRRGSQDLEIVLYAPSYGPPSGDFGGGGRIPKLGDNRYNLNAIPAPCADAFPAESQKFSFTRPSFPLHEFPIFGYQGDQVAYDPDTADPYDPMTNAGPGCEAGCRGEDDVDMRSRTPITLGRWIKGKGEVTIKLTRYDHRVRAFTAARFNITLRRLLPNSVYTLWAVRQRSFSFGRFPGPFGIPSAVVTDKDGNAEVETELRNPFPERATDADGLRLVGIELAYHPDHQNWGACGDRLGVGYLAMRYMDFLPDGSRDLSNLMTKDRL